MSLTSDQNSPMAKRKRYDFSSLDQKQNKSDGISTPNQHDVKQEIQEDSLELIDVHDSTTIDALKIDDMKQKVLVKIFEWLDFPDLLNVANASLKLRGAAGQIYVQNYTQKLVKFNGDALGLNIHETSTAFEIHDARTCLKMFRAFGALIVRLHLNFHGIEVRRIQAISQTLNDYCAETLNALEWHHSPANAIFKKFPKLTELRLKKGTLAGKMVQITEMFPRLCVLELSHMEVADRKCIERTCPKLVRLKVHIVLRSGIDFLKSNVKIALKMNPQIRSLCVGLGCDAELLPYINDMLPLLNVLEIQQPRRQLFDTDILNVSNASD